MAERWVSGLTLGGAGGLRCSAVEVEVGSDVPAKPQRSNFKVDDSCQSLTEAAARILP